MKLMKFIKYIILLFLVQPAFSTDDVEVGKRVPAYIDESGDTIPNIWLQPVYVFPKLVFKNEKQEKF